MSTMPHTFQTAQVVPNPPRDVPNLRFANGQRVRAARTGDLGVIRDRIGQRNADNLYRVAWDQYPYDTDLYAECRLEEALA